MLLLVPLVAVDCEIPPPPVFVALVNTDDDWGIVPLEVSRSVVDVEQTSLANNTNMPAEIKERITPICNQTIYVMRRITCRNERMI